MVYKGFETELVRRRDEIRVTSTTPGDSWPFDYSTLDQAAILSLKIERRANLDLLLCVLPAFGMNFHTLWAASFRFWVSSETPTPKITPGRSRILYANAAMPRSLTLAYYLSKV